MHKISSLYRKDFRETKAEIDAKKSELDRDIAQLDAKIKRLTQMRLDDELPKSEYLEFKSDLDCKKYRLVQQRSELDNPTQTDPDSTAVKIQDFLLQK